MKIAVDSGAAESVIPTDEAPEYERRVHPEPIYYATCSGEPLQNMGEVKVPIRNCGSSGYAWEPERRRAAGMCVYHVGDGLERTERFLFDGESFSPEPGGAYATGR